MQGTLILADHLWCDVFTFFVELVRLLALTVAVDLDLVVSQGVLQYLVAQVREVVQDIVEFHYWVLC